LISSLLLACLLSSRTAAAMTVSTAHATVKIRPTTPPQEGPVSAVLEAARNEFEPFQLIITADRDVLFNVDVNVTDLQDANGHLIPAASIMIYKAIFMNVTAPSSTEGELGEWPDALIPKRDEYSGEVRDGFPFPIGFGRNQPIWIEIYVPQEAAAGLYTGSVTVTADGELPVSVPIRLTVWDFALPSTSTLKSAYSIDHRLLPQGHGLPDSAKVDLVQRYLKANLLHRLTDSDLPSPVEVGRLNSNGTINWAAFDRLFGPFLDGTIFPAGGKLPGAKMTAYQMAVSNHQTDITYLRDYARHFREKGWFDRLFEYTCDEPPRSCSWSTVRAWVDALHQADPELRSLVTSNIQRTNAQGISDRIDLVTPVLHYMDDKPAGAGGDPGMTGNQRSKYGKEVWWYQACDSHGCGHTGGDPAVDPGRHNIGWPSYMIDLPAMFNRVMQWESFKYDIQGELYYDMVYAYGQGDPWSAINYFSGNGDGTLYYPGSPSIIGGSTDIPIETIRLKLIREGMEDYEYMNLLKLLGESAYADQQVARVVTNTYTFTKDPAILYDARKKMAERILLHTAPFPAPDPNSLPPSSEAPPAGGLDPGGTVSSAKGGGCVMAEGNNSKPFGEALSFILLFAIPLWVVKMRTSMKA
jgi:hypothetical protein